MTKSKELKRRARTVLKGKISLATSMVTTLALVALACAALLRRTGFLQSPNLLHKVFFWALLAIMALLCALLEIGLIKFLYDMGQEDTPPHPLISLYAFLNQPDTFILATTFRYLLVAFCFLPALFRATMLPLMTLEPMSIITYLVPVLVLSLAALIPATFFALPFCLTNYILLDEPDMPAHEALYGSLQLMKGQKKRVFLLWLSFVPLLLTVFGSYGIGILWFLPYYHATMSQFYLELTGETVEEAAPEVSE